ncbi:MAG: class I SAM-dependent methyltransferase [Rhodanobacteraceae bacterium]|nr:class I SAM-dependent methyltransferase [Rhodanobacteraceae bacterium]
MTPADPPILPFTGERFTPECVREIWYEHMHRYAYAAPFAHGKRVLDAACGEGYGSALLAQAGAEVLGIDIDEASVAHARSRYTAVPSLRFEQADVTALDHLADADFDLIVSFETLEHVQAQERMLAGFRRLLKPDGILLISSPDKRTYSDERGYHNEFHVRELYRDQFEALLRTQFPAHRLYAQKLLFQSLLWDPDRAPTSASAATLHADGRVAPTADYAALYFLAVCAADERLLPPVAALHTFGDASESVYTHYNDEIRRHIAAGHRLIALDQEIQELRARLARAEALLAEQAHTQGRNP